MRNYRKKGRTLLNPSSFAATNRITNIHTTAKYPSFGNLLNEKHMNESMSKRPLYSLCRLITDMQKWLVPSFTRITGNSGVACVFEFVNVQLLADQRPFQIEYPKGST